ncbi:MAG TPA: M12 family metallo-peptidase [Thermoanaerobaculia bacterium]
MTYLGHVEGADGSSGTIVVIGSVISGSIRILGRPVYVLATDRAGKPVIRAVDPSKLPPDHPAGYGARPGRRPSQPPRPTGTVGDTCTTDDPTRVTVMILYTPEAKTAAGGTDAIESSIYAAIAEANQAFVNSDINMQYELVHLAETSYTSTGNFLTDVCRLHDPGDGFLDGVQAMRDLYKADLVALLVPDSSSCGITYGELIDPSLGCNDASNHDVVSSPANSHEEGAYHIFALSCIQTNFTLPHEFGHSGSARHNWQCDGSDNAPTHSNHGYYYDDGTPAASWRTILTYPSNNPCGHNGNRVPYFSNPAISYLGHPTGTSSGSQPADNHDVLNTTRSILANYRCSAPAPANVWMKDTWGDTGAEPDPDPDIMYASPYTWTRHAADTAAPGFTDRYQHEHQHENPILHQPTWAYVKLHNGGSAGAGGHVKLYYAHASTSLAWPAGWTLIGDITVAASSFAAGATKVVEITWADPPGTGHYCLSARWESAADPIPPETTDIDANTRNSNNVIWRNLEILKTDGGDVTTSFIARPLFGRTFALEFVAPGRRPYLPSGELTVNLKATGAPLVAKPGEGVVEAAPGQYRVHASGGRIDLVLPQTTSAFVTAELRFHRPEKLERRAYRVLVNQVEVAQPGGAPKRVGGMAYDLQP